VGLIFLNTKYQYRARINHRFCRYDLCGKHASACTFQLSIACILAAMVGTDTVPLGVSALMTRFGHLWSGISDEFETTPMATIRKS
jgi:hypothetical protein